MESPPLDDVAQSKPGVTAEGDQEEVEHEDDEDAKEDEHADEDDGDEGATPLENDRRPFEQYILNAGNVAEKKRPPYIMMMVKALGFNFESMYPYSEILSDR
jgi:hypothetical protein